MKTKHFFYFFLFFILLYAFSFSYAGEGSRLNLILKDGKLSADIQNVPLSEVAQEIGKKCGILVELSGTLQSQKDQLLSAKFEDLPMLDSFYRIFRNFNFTYIEGEKLSLLGFGQTPLQNESMQIANVSSSLQRSSKNSSPEIKKEEMKKPVAISAPSRMVEDRKSQPGIPLWRGKSQVYEGENLKLDQGEPLQSPETQNQGEAVIVNKDSKIGSTLNVPLLLDSQGQAISALSSDFAYDPNVLGNPRVMIGDSGMQAEKNVIFNEVRPGLLRVGVIGLNQKLIPDGEVVYITFIVLRGGQILLRSLPTASDPHGNMIPVTFKNGKVTTRK